MACHGDKQSKSQLMNNSTSIGDRGHLTGLVSQSRRSHDGFFDGRDMDWGSASKRWSIPCSLTLGGGLKSHSLQRLLRGWDPASAPYANLRCSARSA